MSLDFKKMFQNVIKTKFVSSKKKLQSQKHVKNVKMRMRMRKKRLPQKAKWFVAWCKI